MIVSAWTNGSSGYGLKINKEDLHFFKREWGTVKILLTLGEKTLEATANIDKNSFWNKCQELISKDIKLWLKEKGLMNWEKGNPPHFELKYIKDNIFEITER